MPRQPKTPQEKKTLSLTKDRRNAYRENDKASRKNIPLARARDHRKNRHRQNQTLAGVERLGEEAAALVESTARQDIRNGQGWTKLPDQPLGDHLSEQRARRARRDS